jgi:hypothetical protein
MNDKKENTPIEDTKLKEFLDKYNSLVDEYGYGLMPTMEYKDYGISVSIKVIKVEKNGNKNSK